MATPNRPSRLETIDLIHMTKRLPELSGDDRDRIIEMAWEDRTPFDAIELQFGLSEKDVIVLMRREMKPSSFRMWRQRVTGRSTKHRQQRSFWAGRFRSANQKGS